MSIEVAITFWDVPLIVYGNYVEGEPQVMYDGTGGGYPGSASDFEIEKITVEDSEIDISELFSHDKLERIKELIIETIES